MSGAERVLALLQARGEDGVSPIDFAAPNVVDGEKPIMRVAARVLDLRKLGHDITTATAANGTAIYRLRALEATPKDIQPAETSLKGLAPSASPRAPEPKVFAVEVCETGHEPMVLFTEVAA